MFQISILFSDITQPDVTKLGMNASKFMLLCE